MSDPEPHTKTLLIIGFMWPEPKATAAGGRMMQLIHFFINHDYSITFACAASETERTSDLDSLGVKKIHIKLNHASFDDFLVGLNPGLVLFDRFMIEEQFGWRVARSAPNALRILETQDLHSLRISRQEALKRGAIFSVGDWLGHETTKREIASIYRSDLSLVLSSFELGILRNTIGINSGLMLHLPFLMAPIHELTAANWLGFEARSDFICIGNGKHAPNVDSVVWLKKGIWPILHKALPKAVIHVYGAYLPQKITQLNDSSTGFFVRGWATDAYEVMGKARVNLAPLRFGAGIKGKLIDAMCTGTPNVTTTIGAEGMRGERPWNGEIADDPEAFAHAAIKLYCDREAWQMAQYNGIKIINELYDKNKLDRVFHSKLKKVRDDLESHRSQNFIGGMLWHHTMASTKYMSKWIEAKQVVP
ncbi:glycosyltransferase family 4 protein [Flavobacteriaceae bacterium F89]|uniref:Glycosyltransferase family 4 protein n=1 Tax=Cerina litoralis TaxID=2874477 RepID=A0AAE3JNC9_9FLAO|nr:glycosyltransferase [Cerina litoralis]MCG2460815.1 glycosyltransferase family 4 protein [Cerina litoralis]